jgi:hypothetical protein
MPWSEQTSATPPPCRATGQRRRSRWHRPGAKRPDAGRAQRPRVLVASGSPIQRMASGGLRLDQHLADEAFGHAPPPPVLAMSSACAPSSACGLERTSRRDGGHARVRRDRGHGRAGDTLENRTMPPCGDQFRQRRHRRRQGPVARRVLQEIGVAASDRQTAILEQRQRGALQLMPRRVASGRGQTDTTRVAEGTSSGALSLSPVPQSARRPAWLPRRSGPDACRRARRQRRGAWIPPPAARRTTFIR